MRIRTKKVDDFAYTGVVRFDGRNRTPFLGGLSCYLAYRNSKIKKIEWGSENSQTRQIINQIGLR